MSHQAQPAPDHPASDDELMQAAAKGSRYAFAELGRRHRGWVRSFLTGCVRDPDLAEDLTQETFCRVYASLHRYEPQGTFAAWLRRIALNLARDSVRSRREPPLSLDDLPDLPAEKGRFDPAAALQAKELRQEMRDAIEALPDDQRLAIVMHYFGCMSPQEIAWAMKCPVGTVRSRLFYGLRRVRQSLESRGSQAPEPAPHLKNPKGEER